MGRFNSNMIINTRQEKILKALYEQPGGLESIVERTGIDADYAEYEILALIRMGALSSDIFGNVVEYWVNTDFFDPDYWPLK